MIKRNEIKEAIYLNKLANDIPEFALFEDFDNLIYVDYDRLGTYLLRILESLKEDNNKKLIIDKIFDHLNSIFEIHNELILNIIEVCIFENLINVRYGYDVAKKFMSKEMYQYFIKKFPYKKYKDFWNTSNYYTDEEYQKILNLFGNGTD